MTGTITWEEFLQFSKQLLKISDQIIDGWILEGNQDILGGAYLTKKSVKVTQLLGNVAEDFSEDDFEITRISNICLSWEYHILYCPSYSVPVLYFNVWGSDGRILSLEEIWAFSREYFQGRLEEEKWSILSQKEHPILRRPFFHLHPCHTAQLLSCIIENSWNPLVTWLSSVGPSVGLSLALTYSSPSPDIG